MKRPNLAIELDITYRSMSNWTTRIQSVFLPIIMIWQSTTTTITRVTLIIISIMSHRLPTTWSWTEDPMASSRTCPPPLIMIIITIVRVSVTHGPTWLASCPLVSDHFLRIHFPPPGPSSIRPDHHDHTAACNQFLQSLCLLPGFVSLFTFRLHHHQVLHSLVLTLTHSWVISSRRRLVGLKSQTREWRSYRKVTTKKFMMRFMAMVMLCSGTVSFFRGKNNKRGFFEGERMSSLTFTWG